MHIKKNIRDNILETIMNIKGKTTDTIKMHLDIRKMVLRSTLNLSKDRDNLKMPPTPYTLSPLERRMFCQFLKEIKVSDGFSSNISYCINMKETKIFGLKSHDCHIMLKHLLPLALRTTPVKEALIELSMFFDILGAKELKMDELEQIEAQIPHYST